MFTGIVREVGRVVAVEGGPDGQMLVVRAPATAAGTAVGDSVAIGGVCLTAESFAGDRIDEDPALAEINSHLKPKDVTEG